ncbi:MAG: hypothetical protein EZS28_010209 [Streblomastix strix]|uniref:Uncharacterized protein n=1 Tax=Streblomastix strix TaxID=222440 RepID=A0A5J4WIZ6_9EUKA|nr:MAG: hypothetical protein EZS28_010209 [Streblomastix strix]
MSTCRLATLTQMTTSIDVKVNSFILSGLVKCEDLNVLPEFSENVIPPENPQTSLRVVRIIVETFQTDEKYLKYQEIEAVMQMIREDEDSEDSKERILTHKRITL